MVKYSLGGYPYNMTIDSGKIFVGGSFGYKVIDISSGSIRNCNVNSQLRYSFGTTIDAGNIFSYRSNTPYFSEKENNY